MSAAALLVRSLIQISALFAEPEPLPDSGIATPPLAEDREVVAELELLERMELLENIELLRDLQEPPPPPQERPSKAVNRGL